jgi:hypothetical protein
MKPKKPKSRRITKFWTVEEINKIVPLARSLLLSVRDLVIRGNGIGLQIERLGNKSGRPTRNDLIEKTNLLESLEQVSVEVEGICREVSGLGFFLYDAICAVAQFPFAVKDDQGVRTGAFFNYSPFDVNENGEPVITWRLNDEEPTTRHPLSELGKPPT